MNPTPAPVPALFRIPLQDAVAYTKNWRDQPHDDNNYVKAFTVNLEELKEILYDLKDSNGANAVRFYIAEKPVDPNPGSPITGFQETLILVGVTGFDPENNIAGDDILDFVPKEGSAVSGCYDFTYPCPDTCATNSPLFNDLNVWTV